MKKFIALSFHWFIKNQVYIFMGMIILGLILLSSIWIPAYFVAGNRISQNSLAVGYPALRHTRWVIDFILLPLLVLFLTLHAKLVLSKPFMKSITLMFFIPAMIFLFPLGFVYNHVYHDLSVLFLSLTLAQINAESMSSVKDKNPALFYFSRWAILYTMFGALLSLLSETSQLSYLYTISKHLYYYGAFPFLILTLFLMPYIQELLFEKAVLPADTKKNPVSFLPPASIAIGLTLYVLTYLAEFFFAASKRAIPLPATQGVRMLILIYFILRFNLFKWMTLPPRTVKVFLTAALLFMGIGLSLTPFFYNEGRHLIHLFFLGGVVPMLLIFCMMIIKKFGKNDPYQLPKQFYIAVALFMLASAGRVVAPIFPMHYEKHLLYDALIVIAALSTFTVSLFLLFRKSNHQKIGD